MATGTFSPQIHEALVPRPPGLSGGCSRSPSGPVTLRLLPAAPHRGGPASPTSRSMFAGFLLGAALVLFLVFFDRVLHRMRPVKVAALVARAGRQTVERARRGRRRPPARTETPGARRGGTAALVVRSHQPRRDPGHRPARGLCAGPGISGLRRGPRALGGRLRLVPAGPSSRSTARWRTPGAPSAGCGACWRWASSAPSSRTRLRAAHPRRHRHPGPVTGGQRPDHRRPGTRPPRGPALADRPAPRGSRGAGSTATTPGRCAGGPRAAVGGPAGARRDRDPGVRRAVDPGGAPAAGDAGGAAPDGAARVRARGRCRAGAARICCVERSFGASPDADRVRVSGSSGHRRAAAAGPLRP